MPAKTVIDLDSFLSEHQKEVESKRNFIPVQLFGREWRISNRIGAFTGLQAGEGEVAAFIAFLMNVAHPDERADFHKALYASELDEEGLIQLISKLMEVIADHPTKSSSASSRSAKTRVAARKSAAT